VEDTQTEEELQQWRARGPLGKLHNIVVYVQRSPQRQASFLKHSNGKRLVRDNKTRWNSWYLMLACALTGNMKKAINNYCIQEFEELHDDSLQDTDWAILQSIHNCLLHFYEATMATEGRQATLERVLLSMEFLLDQLESGKKQYEEDPFLSPCFNSAWKVMNKYYGLTER
jgi:hypothetical protein